MTKTEAAETIAMTVRVWVRKTGNEATFLMCQEIISERLHESYAGTVVQEAARLANARTVWRKVKAWQDEERYSCY